MRENKEIIKTPTLENSDFLVNGTDISKTVLNVHGPLTSGAFFAVLNFDDAWDISRLKKEYSERKTTSSSATLNSLKDLLKEDSTLGFLATGIASITVPIVTYIFTSALFVSLGSFELSGRISYSIPLMITVMASVWWFFALAGIISNDDKPYKELPLKDRKILSETQFLYINGQASSVPGLHYIWGGESISRTYCQCMSKVEEVFYIDEEDLKNVSLTELSQAYNDYMKLLVFVIANKDAVSPKLLGEYSKELGAKSRHLESCAQEVLELSEMYKKGRKEIAQYSDDLSQEMLDDDALRAMPLTTKAEL